jgi:uncharacterized membrane protein HdeD (DUF308 family)
MGLLIDTSPENMNQFTLNARRIGIVMIVIGLIGIILPNLISLAINTFIGGIFLLSAVALGYIAWRTRSSSITMWLKPFVLLALALMVLLHPAVVLSVLGLLLALYFLFDGFAGIALAVEIKPASGWGFMLFDGILSFAMGTFVLLNWPLASSWIIGLLIGISFLFDGIALYTVAGKLKTATT